MRRTKAGTYTAYFVIAFVLLAAVFTWWFIIHRPAEESPSVAKSNIAEVERVVDGDTVEVLYAGKHERIRFLNVDTPETKHPTLPVQCLGPEASAYTKAVLKAGTKIRLDFDKQQRDEHGRLVVGVWLGNRLLNEELVEHGLAVPVKFKPNYKYYDRMMAAMKVAQDKQIGLFDRGIDCTLRGQIYADRPASAVERGRRIAVLTADVAEHGKGHADEDLINKLGKYGLSIYARPSVRGYVQQQAMILEGKVPDMDDKNVDPGKGSEGLDKTHDPRKPERPQIREKPEKIRETPVERPTDKI